MIDPDTAFGVVLLVLAGISISSLGAMIGLGGGFLMVPFLVLVMGLQNEEAVATSLAMIFVNSSSTSLANFRVGLIQTGRVCSIPFPRSRVCSSVSSC